MARVFYVKNKKTKEILNQKGGWSDSVNSYRVSEFNTENEATAAFPAGVDCEVVSINRKEDKP